MLNQMRGIHAGKPIAVLGSGKSLDLFQRQQGVVIGVNGAKRDLVRGDYFLSNDEVAHKQAWFPKPEEGVTLILLPVAAMHVPAMYPDPVQRQALVQFYQGLMDRHPERVKNHKDFEGTSVLMPGLEEFDRWCENFPLPAPPHFTFRRIRMARAQDIEQDAAGQLVSREQTSIIKGGDSACVGVQIAHLMGASEIHLYGVQFTNSPTWETLGHEYAPGCDGMGGVTSEAQRAIFNAVIQAVQRQGTRVISHGYTRLDGTECMEFDLYVPDGAR